MDHAETGPVTASVLTNFGLRVPDLTPSAIGAYGFGVDLSVRRQFPGGVVLNWADSNNPSKRGLPYGQIGVELYAYFGDAPANDPTLFTYMGRATRNPHSLDLAPANAGLVCSMAGRFVTGRGLTGPFGSVVSFVST